MAAGGRDGCRRAGRRRPASVGTRRPGFRPAAAPKESPLPLSGIAATWHSLGGILTSGVAASTVPGGKTYVFALGTDNQVWMRVGVWPALAPWSRL